MSDRHVLVVGRDTTTRLLLELLGAELPEIAVTLVVPETPALAPVDEQLSDAATQAGADVRPVAELDAVVTERAWDLVIGSNVATLLEGAVVPGAGIGHALNIHHSLLPNFATNAPEARAIMDGVNLSGVTIHAIGEDPRRVSVAFRSPMPVHPADTGAELSEKLARLAVGALARILRGWIEGRGIPTVSDDLVDARIADDESLADGEHIDWSRPAVAVRDTIRALAPPLPGAYTVLYGEHLVLTGVSVAAATGSAKAPGMVELGRDGWPLVWTGDAPVRIEGFMHDGSERAGSELLALRGVQEREILS